ncbi:MAG: proton-conducting transporter membrane subunit [archaeon]|nr:proton-conducting transporter membrane subunit [archaeon]
MDSSILFVILLSAPAAAAAISLLPKEGIESIVSSFAAASSLAVSLVILVERVSGSFGFFYSDGLTQIMVFTVSAIYLSSVVYSKFYVRHVKEPLFKFRWYYSLVDLFAFTMLLSIVVNDLGFIWIAVEATTVTSALLVALERERTSIESAWRYTLIVSAGLAVSLLSVVLVYFSQGTLTISELMVRPASNIPIMAVAVAFALVGYGTKAGIAPMHTWLPDAHSEAPSPISAMFSGILLPTSLYAFTRTFTLLHGTSAFGSMQDLAIGFGIFTALVAAVIIGFQRNYKRMLAYSSMENMGIVLVGLALGGIGALGAIIQIVAHAFAKSSAFYESGNIFVSYDSKNMSEVQGLIGKLRSTGYLFSLSCFSVTGAPPFGIFIGEFFILIQAFNTGNYLVAALLAIAYMYAFIGLNRQSTRMVFGSQNETELVTNVEDKSPKEIETEKSEDKLSIVVPLINLIVSLIIGLYMIPVFLQAATSFGL